MCLAIKLCAQTSNETIEVIENNSDKWIFVDDQLVDYQNVPEVDWSQTGSVRILPGLVGGIINQS